MFCQPLQQSTKGEDVMQKLTKFLESEDLDWGNLCWICTDGAPAMLGSFFSRQEMNMKRHRLDARGSFHQQNAAVVEASFLVSLEIAKEKKPHTIGEELILPCACRALQFLACTLQLHSCVRLSLNINNHEV